MRPNPVKRLLKDGKPAVGTWLSLGSITAARFLARAGFDWLTVDIEHILVDDRDGHAHVRVHRRRRVRRPGPRAVATATTTSSGCSTTAGYGVVVPMVNTRQEAEDAVAACLYPPRGTRSVGGSVHALNFAATPADYYAKANDEIADRPPVRAHPGGAELRRGVLGARHRRGVRRPERPGREHAQRPTASRRRPEAFKQALADILAGCKRNKVAAGIHTFSVEDAKTRIAEGWQFIAVSSELRFMMDGAKKVVDGLGLGKAAATWRSIEANGRRQPTGG